MSFETYMITRTPSGEGTSIEFEGTFTDKYVLEFITEAKMQGYTTELHNDAEPKFIRVVFEWNQATATTPGRPWVYREFYPIEPEPVI